MPPGQSCAEQCAPISREIVVFHIIHTTHKRKHCVALSIDASVRRELREKATLDSLNPPFFVAVEVTWQCQQMNISSLFQKSHILVRSPVGNTAILSLPYISKAFNVGCLWKFGTASTSSSRRFAGGDDAPSKIQMHILLVPFLHT